jgi:hypothetical protein
MDYFAEYIGMSPKQANVLPDGFSTIRIKGKQFKRRDPSRRW